MGDLEHAAKLLDGCALFGLEALRGLADGSKSDFEFESEAVGMGFDLIEVG